MCSIISVLSSNYSNNIHQGGLWGGVWGRSNVRISEQAFSMYHFCSCWLMHPNLLYNDHTLCHSFCRPICRSAPRSRRPRSYPAAALPLPWCGASQRSTRGAALSIFHIFHLHTPVVLVGFVDACTLAFRTCPCSELFFYTSFILCMSFKSCFFLS